MALVAGVDSSTQSTKVEIRDIESGELIASGRAPHPPVRAPASEQDPETWWRALCSALSQVSEVLGDVMAISIVAQQHGLVCLASDGSSLRPARLWNDTTSAAQADSLVKRLGAETWANRCGLVPVPSITITKLAWLADNEPDVLTRAAAFMLPHDYLTMQLTGNHTTDRGDASGTGWWSPITGRYEPDLLRLVVEDPVELISRLPQVLGPWEAAGVVTGFASGATGLKEGIPVAVGTGDNMGAAYGLDLRPGDLAMSLGTSGTVYAVAERPVIDRTGIVTGFADATDRFLPLVATLNATRVTDTVGRWIGAGMGELAELALGARPAPDLVMKPYFDGERTPNLPDAKGMISGLDNETTRADVAGAAHIGVVCGLLAGIDALTSAGVDTDGQLHLTGGGAKSTAFQQWVADLWGRPILVHVDSEAAAAGACRQAAVVIAGEQADWRVTSDVVIGPRAGVGAAAYREAFNATSV
ncbi:MAG: xylulokinase [Actinomycetota bacterium]